MFTTDNWINIFGIVSSLILSLVSVWISISTLRLTKKSIDDANKPIISVYVDVLATVNFEKCLVIKNFGRTPARVTQLVFTSSLDKINESRQLSSIVNGVIAPNQKFMTTIDNDFHDNISGYITYTDSYNKKYTEQFNVSCKIGSDLLYKTSGNTSNPDIPTAIKQSIHSAIREFK